MIDRSNLISIGSLFKPHGYKGEINAQLDYPVETPNNFPFFIEIDALPVPFFAENIRPKGEGCLIKFENIDSDTEVSELVNHELFAEKNVIADLLDISIEELEVQVDDCIGFMVVDVSSNDKLGIVTGIEEGVEYDYLTVENTETKNIFSIPYIEEFVESIIDEGDPKEIRVNLPEGFLEINND